MTRLPDLVNGPWQLADLEAGRIGQPAHGLKVFSCFHCGGGSTMGYKLAGFDVLGGVEIDPEMMAAYRRNHHPRRSFLMPIQEFKALPRIEDELMDLDVLDGSPPCSSFSMAGSREDAWGKEKKFREGQAEQRLDDLFFHFIDVADRLRPRMVVAENVKGLIAGNARGYVKEIFAAFRKAGYDTQLFLLNASRMGVAQARERTIFVARRRDLGIPELELAFDERPVTVAEAIEGAGGDRRPLSEAFAKWWFRTPPGSSFSKGHPDGSYFNTHKLHPGKPSPTVTATGGAVLAHWERPVSMSGAELRRLQSFPEDYDFGELDPKYVCGMSVPPLMMQRLALRLARSLLDARRA
jgi:DNA (cytosine-5)-methyltransferase 1